MNNIISNNSSLAKEEMIETLLNNNPQLAVLEICVNHYTGRDQTVLKAHTRNAMFTFPKDLNLPSHFYNIEAHVEDYDSYTALFCDKQLFRWIAAYCVTCKVAKEFSGRMLGSLTPGEAFAQWVKESTPVESAEEEYYRTERELEKYTKGFEDVLPLF